MIMNFIKIYNITMTIIKNFIVFAFALLVMVGCSNDITEQKSDADIQGLSTNISLNGMRMSTRRTIMDFSDVIGQSDAYFYIRIDNRIPGCESYSSKLYFPQRKDGGSMFSNLNRGSIDKGSVSDWSFGNGDISYYIYDTTGKKTVTPLTHIPSLKDIIAANANTGDYDLSAIDTTSLKVIWYIVKYESGVWHVDGVLTYKTTSDITEVDGIDEDKTLENKKDNNGKFDSTKNVEVDIHQQVHKDWGEIKTSIHLRDTVNLSHLVITIPIKSEYIIERDDFAVRQWLYFKGYDKLDDDKFHVSATVTHTSNAIIYDIICDPKYIKECMDGESRDGITIEIHSYTHIDGKKNEEIWNMMRKSSVKPSIGDGLKISTAFDYSANSQIDKIVDWN